MDAIMDTDTPKKKIAENGKRRHEEEEVDEAGDDASGGSDDDEKKSPAAGKKTRTVPKKPPAEMYLRQNDEKRHKELLAKLTRKFHEKAPTEEEIERMHERYKSQPLEGYASELKAKGWEIVRPALFTKDFRERVQPAMNEKHEYNGRIRRDLGAKLPKDREPIDEYLKAYDGLRIDNFAVLQNNKEKEERFLISLDEFPGLGTEKQKGKIGKGKEDGDHYYVELLGSRCDKIGELASRLYNWIAAEIWQNHFGLIPTQLLVHRAYTANTKNRKSAERKQKRKAEKDSKPEADADAAEEEEAATTTKPPAAKVARTKTSASPSGATAEAKSERAKAAIAENDTSIQKFIEETSSMLRENAAQVEREIQASIGDSKALIEKAKSIAGADNIASDTLVDRMVDFLFWDKTANADALKKRVENFKKKFDAAIADKELAKKFAVIVDACAKSKDSKWAKDMAAIADSDEVKKDGKNAVATFCLKKLFATDEGKAILTPLVLLVGSSMNARFAEHSVSLHEESSEKLGKMSDAHKKLVKRYEDFEKQAKLKIEALAHEKSDLIEKVRQLEQKLAKSSATAAAAAADDDEEDAPPVAKAKPSTPSKKPAVAKKPRSDNEEEEAEKPAPKARPAASAAAAADDDLE